MLFRIAWRYIIGKKSTQAIQIISWVSILAMAIGTACLIIVLSVFNGFEGFIKGLYSDYYTEARIIPIQGKSFIPSAQLQQQIQQDEAIEAIAYSLEEKVLLVYDDNQAVAHLKGVSANYPDLNGIRKHIKYGEFDIDTLADYPSITLGMGLSNRLSVNEQSPLPLNAYVLKGDLTSFTLNPENKYTNQLYLAKGVFVLQEDLDNQLAFAALITVQRLLGKPHTITSMELKLKPRADYDEMLHRMKERLSQQGLKLENRLEQNKTLYFILKSERVAVFAILCLMMAIASFNIVGSLSMLIMEKEKDIAILQTMGLTSGKVRQLFLLTGVLLSLLGAFIGSLLAFIICSLQKMYGIVKLGNSDTFLIDAYPVQMKPLDFLLVLFTVVIIALLASFFPAMKAARKHMVERIKA